MDREASASTSAASPSAALVVKRGRPRKYATVEEARQHKNAASRVKRAALRATKPVMSPEARRAKRAALRATRPVMSPEARRARRTSQQRARRHADEGRRKRAAEAMRRKRAENEEYRKREAEAKRRKRQSDRELRQREAEARRQYRKQEEFRKREAEAKRQLEAAVKRQKRREQVEETARARAPRLAATTRLDKALAQDPFGSACDRLGFAFAFPHAEARLKEVADNSLEACAGMHQRAGRNAAMRHSRQQAGTTKAASTEASTQCYIRAATQSTQYSVEHMSKSVQWCAPKTSKSVQVAFMADLLGESLPKRQRTAPGSTSRVAPEQEDGRQQRLPMPAHPRCAACNMQYSHNVMLHPLPACENDRQRWIDFVRKCCGSDSLDWIPPEHEKSFVCSLHFEKHCFSRTWPVKHLRPGAIPTLYRKAAHISAENRVRTRLSDVQLRSGPSFLDKCQTSGVSAYQSVGNSDSGLGSTTQSMQCSVKSVHEPVLSCTTKKAVNVQAAFLADLPA